MLWVVWRLWKSWKKCDGRGSSSLNVTPVSMPSKRIFMVFFTLHEAPGDILHSSQPTKFSGRDLRNGSKTATSVGGVTTVTRWSEIDSMTARFTAGKTGPYRLSAGNVHIEVPPREELLAQEKSSQRTKCFHSQSAKTLLKDFVESNPPNKLDPGHTTTSLSAYQMIQFTRAVWLEVTLESYGFLEDFLQRARGVSNLCAHDQQGRSLFPSVAECAVIDSVASQSRYSLPTVSGFKATNAKEGAAQADEAQRLAVADQPGGSCSMEAVTKLSRHDDMPLADISSKLKSKERRKWILSNYPVKAVQIQFLSVVETKVGGYWVRRCCNKFHWLNWLRLETKTRWNIGLNFNVKVAESMPRCVPVAFTRLNGTTRLQLFFGKTSVFWINISLRHWGEMMLECCMLKVGSWTWSIHGLSYTRNGS